MALVHNAFVHESTQVWVQLMDGECEFYRQFWSKNPGEAEAKAEACAESINDLFFPEFRMVDANLGKLVPMIVGGK